MEIWLSQLVGFVAPMCIIEGKNSCNVARIKDGTIKGLLSGRLTVFIKDAFIKPEL